MDTRSIIPKFQKRRDYAWNKLNKINDIFCAIARVSYYLFPNISNYNIGTSNDIIDYFIKEAGVLVRADSGSIGTPDHFRVSCCAPWERLAIGLEAIQDALSKLKNKKG